MGLGLAVVNGSEVCSAPQNRKLDWHHSLEIIFLLEYCNFFHFLTVFLAGFEGRGNTCEV